MKRYLPVWLALLLIVAAGASAVSLIATDSAKLGGVTPTAAGLAILDDAANSNQRTTLGLGIGTDVQAYDADLTTWAGNTPTATFLTLVDDGSTATLRTSLGVGSGNTPGFTDVTTSSNSGYDESGWDGSTQVPTKDAFRDKIETLQVGDADLTSLASQGGTGNAAAVRTAADTWTTTQLVSGKYTPTCTDTTNIAATTEGQFNYVRVGSYVFVTGVVNVDPTSGTVPTVFKIPLPIASNLAATDDLSGTAGEQVIYGGSTGTPKVIGDITADNCSVEWGSIQGTAARDVSVSFSYEIL